MQSPNQTDAMSLRPSFHRAALRRRCWGTLRMPCRSNSPRTRLLPDCCQIVDGCHHPLSVAQTQMAPVFPPGLIPPVVQPIFDFQRLRHCSLCRLPACRLQECGYILPQLGLALLRTPSASHSKGILPRPPPPAPRAPVASAWRRRLPPCPASRWLPAGAGPPRFRFPCFPPPLGPAPLLTPGR